MPATTTPLPLLDTDHALSALRELRSRQPVKYAAFYSSQLGGIVTDPALMVIPFDDHMVHRGHGIFDTAGLVAGRIYDLEAHLDRFLRSAGHSKLALPCPRERMREIIIQTVAASGQRDGAIRYWISSGPGSLELSPAAGAEPGFFVMVFPGLSYPERWYTDGLKVMTTTYPIKPALYAITKSTNYLPNVLMQMEAKAAGMDNGVFIDAEGHVGESSNMNVAFVTARRRAAPSEVRSHPRRLHVAEGAGTGAGARRAGPADRRRSLRHPGERRARRTRDAAARQLRQGSADRRMGRPTDRRWQARSGGQSTAGDSRRGHANGRSAD